MIESLTTRFRAYSGTVNKSKVFSFKSGSFVLKNIDGLGPVKASLTSLEVPEEAGGVFLTAYTPKRNIVITIGFDPDYSVGASVTALRNELYQIFPIGYEIEMDFLTTHKGLMKIKGIVESNEPNIFSDDPQAVVSVVCFQPYFKSTSGIVTVPYTFAPAPGNPIVYPGEVEAGFLMQVTLASGATGNGIFFRKNDVYNSMNFGLANFIKQNGDIIKFSSVRNDKYVQYVRSSQTFNALGLFRGSLTNLALVPGENIITWSPDATVLTNGSISYEPLYAGL